MNKPVARDRDGDILNSDEEILEAAKKGYLPDDFDYMAFRDVKSEFGYTPAHYAAYYGHLPIDFDFMAFKDCKNNDGETPAHYAAINGDLPADFDFMAFKGCKNKLGETPADMAERYNNLPKRPLAGQGRRSSPADPSGQFKNAREAETFDYSLEEDNGPR